MQDLCCAERNSLVLFICNVQQCTVIFDDKHMYKFVELNLATKNATKTW